MSAIHLFTGENAFTLQEEVQRWTSEFAKKYGDENLTKFDASSVTFMDVLQGVSIAPFIAEKRLVVLDGIPKCSKEEFHQLVEQMHPDTVLLFVAVTLDKRLSLTKELLATASIKEFPLCIGQALHTWMDAYSATCGGSLLPEARSMLLERLGNNQQLLSQEIAKLALYCSGRDCTKEDVDTLVLCCGERQIWGLMDLIGQGQNAQALAYLRRLFEQGESPYGVWGMILWMICSLVQVAAAVNEGVTSPGAIAKKAGVNFGSVRSLLPIAQRINQEQLSSIVGMALSYDIALKTGGYRATTDNTQELMTLIDRTVLACCAGTS